MEDKDPTISMLTLNVDGLNMVIKNQRLSDQTICWRQETYFKYKDKDSLKEMEQKAYTTSKNKYDIRKLEWLL